MEFRLDVDSKRSLKELTITVNDLIAAIVSLHGTIEKNTAMWTEAIEGAK